MLKSRKEKIERISKKRDKNLIVILENVQDPKNIGPIIRTVEGFGFWKIIYINTKNYSLNHCCLFNNSSGALKWIKFTTYRNYRIIDRLKKDGYKIIGTVLNKTAKNISQISLRGKIAIIFGNEVSGISEKLLSKTGNIFYIPMFGLTQSLNVASACAIILYEASKQRRGF